MPKKKTKKFDVTYIGENCETKLKNYGFSEKWLEALSIQYGFEKYEYLEKFKAFRCYKGGKHEDWIDINNLSVLNGEKPKAQIKQRHSKVQNPVIQYPWRM